MSDDPTKAQLAEAKALIQQKRYADARKVLKRINDPLARQWEAKLNTIAPTAPASSGAVINYVIGGVAGLIIGLLIGLVIGNSLGARNTTATIAAFPTTIAATLVEIPNPTLPIIMPSPTAICDPQTWWNDHQEIVARFLDTAETASQTSRISLSSVILEMRKAYRDFDALDYPDCVEEIYRDIRSGMNTAIDGYNAFMGQNDIMSSVNLKIASQYFYDADQALKKVNAFGDYRMSDTSVFIWGGDKPSGIEATHDYQTRFPMPTDPALDNFHATASAQASKPK